MRIKLIQWNISYNCKIDKIIEYLKSHIKDKTIICLQEVLVSFKEELIEGLQPDNYSYSLDYRKPGLYDGKNRKMGVLTLVFGGQIKESNVLERTIFPDRTLYSKLELNNKKVSILNFHSLTGVGYKNAKGSNFASIAEFLQKTDDLDFFCCDANEPKTDSFNLDELEFWDPKGRGKYASLIFGNNKVHKLVDPVVSENIFKELPVSYYTAGTPRRYDYIFKASKWKTESLNFYYEDSKNASSDHSIVVGVFNL